MSIDSAVERLKGSSLDIISSPTSLAPYESLMRGRDGDVSIVVKPLNAGELSEVAKILSEELAESVTIAGRTGLVEAQCGHGIVIDVSAMNRVFSLNLSHDRSIILSDPIEEGKLSEKQLKIWRDELQNEIEKRQIQKQDLKGASLCVGAGVAIDQINGNNAAGITGILEYIDLMVPVVMGSTATASSGAVVANGSAGANAVKYGTGADMAKSVKGVLGNGNIVEQRNPGRAKASDEEPVIRSDRFSHGDSLIGSQGAFGIITEVEFLTEFVPEEKVMALFPVENIEKALEILELAQVLFTKEEGKSVDLFEIIAEGTLRRAESYSREKTIAATGGTYYVLISIISDRELEQFDLTTSLVGDLLGSITDDNDVPIFPEGKGVDFDTSSERFMNIREACSEMNNTREKLAYDVVVPLKYMDKFFAELEKSITAEAPDAELDIFGHAGVGASHIHICADGITAQNEVIDKAVFDSVQKYNGSPWAEHGVGQKWAEEWQKRTPKEVQEKMIDIIRKNDPKNVFGSRLFGMNKLIRNL